jgi:hypothetical protein
MTLASSARGGRRGLAMIAASLVAVTGPCCRARARCADRQVVLARFLLAVVVVVSSTVIGGRRDDLAGRPGQPASRSSSSPKVLTCAVVITTVHLLRGSAGASAGPAGCLVGWAALARA